MRRDSARIERDVPTGFVQSALEINFLHEEEVRGIESTYRVPGLLPDQEHSPRSPVHVGATSIVDVSDVPEPSSQAWNTVKEDRTAEYARQRREVVHRRLRRPVVVDEAWGDRSHRTVVVEYRTQMLKSFRGKMGVRVDGEHIASRKEFRPEIDGSSVTEVRASLRDPNGWPTRTHVLGGTVGRSVVHYCDRDLRASLHQKARDARIEPRLAVVARDDCRDASTPMCFDDPF
jgi:hypothetical protein